ARALGGVISDKFARARGLDGRTQLLFILMLGEGAGLMWFSRTDTVTMAVSAMLVFGLFTHMACGATYALVPFVDRKSLGGIAGIVGAGGNVGAVAAGFLMKAVGDVQECFWVLGITALVSALCALAVRFSADHKQRERELYEAAEATRNETAVATSVPATA